MRMSEGCLHQNQKSPTDPTGTLGDTVPAPEVTMSAIRPRQKLGIVGRGCNNFVIRLSFVITVDL